MSATKKQTDQPARSQKPETVLPHDTESERAVIGALFVDPDRFDEVALVITAGDFLDPACACAYKHMLAIHESGKKPDWLLVWKRIEKTPDFELIGGAANMAEMASYSPTAAHASYYAESIRDKALARAMINVSRKIYQDANDPTIDPSELLAKGEAEFLAIRDSRSMGLERVQDATAMLSTAFASIQSRRGRGTLPGLRTGLTDLDQVVAFRPEELTIVAARPSMGKTALAIKFALHIACNQAERALFVSLEMSAAQVGERILSGEAEVDSHTLADGSYTDQEAERLAETAARLSLMPIVIDDTPRRGMTEIAAVARREKRRGGLGCIIVDYLQLIEGSDPRQQREQQVAAISRRLKGLARDLKIPVICLAQLNRSNEAREDKRPTLSSLRESGAIEQDADVVMLLHREEYYWPDRPEWKGVAEIDVKKQRNGRTGVTYVHWHAPYTLFADMPGGSQKPSKSNEGPQGNDYVRPTPQSAPATPRQKQSGLYPETDFSPRTNHG